jgi:NADH-quinone oxidoreductase subunit L
MDFVIRHSYLIPLLPLLGAAVAGFFGARYLKGNSHWPIWIGVGGSAVLSFALLFGMLAQSHPQHEGSEPIRAAEHASAPAGDAVLARAQVEDEADVPTTEPPENAEDARVKNFPTLVFARHLFTWIRAGSFRADAGFFFDPLTAVMLCVVTGIGFLITVFSKGYMAGEEGYFRFFAYLGLFIFMMTILVMGENLLMLYLGWEGVGLCSYLLIGYYYDRPSAREAAKKAFIVNRVGDFGFGLGIMLCFLAFGTISFFGNLGVSTDGLLEQAAAAARDTQPLTDFKKNALNVIPFLLMLGAFGKSAQFPLYVWLPDAMEGPTPVSALIHAATMVTAGVYMIARCSTLFVASQAALTAITVVGAFTALFAATIALRQFDLKKVFAYSTVSQLGFMFVGVGVLAPVAGVFHLVTHAFFKALLFLGSGVVMHAMAGVLDMRQMSGLRRVLPWTDKFMLVGCLALAGFPFFSGFFSKDEIVAAAFNSGPGGILLGGVLLLTAFLTAYYTFRLYFRVFRGPLVLPEPPGGTHGHGAHDANADVQSHGHGHGDAHHNYEPLSMMLPLAILVIGAIFAGYLNWPELEGRQRSLGSFLGQSPSFVRGFLAAQDVQPALSGSNFGLHGVSRGPEEHELFSPVMILSAFVALMGIGLAWALHLSDRARAERIAGGLAPLTRLLEAKYWVDEIYDAMIVQPLWRLGQTFFWIDRILVDGIVGAMGWVPQLSGAALKLTVQRGYLQGYAAAMLFGVAIILLIIFL